MTANQGDPVFIDLIELFAGLLVSILELSKALLVFQLSSSFLDILESPLFHVSSSKRPSSHTD